MARAIGYWEQRKARELYENLIPVEEAAEEMRRLYFLASKDIEEQAWKIVRRFQLEHNLSEAKARELLSTILTPTDMKGILRALRADPANQELVAELESQAYAARLRRLVDTQRSIDTVITALAEPLQTTFDKTLRTVAERSFLQSMIDVQEQTGVSFPVPPLDPRRVTEILERRWSGQNFSERIWVNTQQLAESVKRELMLGILTGKSRTRMAADIQEEFGVASYKTRRLIRTEGTYVSGQMDLETYRTMGVENYQYTAILDRRTSEICRELDGQVFPVASATPGVNYPPMHPWCRSTTVPAMPKGLEDLINVVAYDNDGNQIVHSLTEDNAARAEQARRLGNGEAVTAPQFAGNKGLNWYSENEVKAMSEEAQDIVNKYVSNDSKHNGTVVMIPEEDKLVAFKDWDCSIHLRNETSMHTIIHEHIHAHSASYFDKETYKANVFLEEGPVELLAQEISAAEGFDVTGSDTYKLWVDELRQINRGFKLYPTDLEFAQALIEVPLPERYSWLDRITTAALHR